MHNPLASALAKLAAKLAPPLSQLQLLQKSAAVIQLQVLPLTTLMFAPIKHLAAGSTALLPSAAHSNLATIHIAHFQIVHMHFVVQPDKVRVEEAAAQLENAAKLPPVQLAVILQQIVPLATTLSSLVIPTQSTPPLFAVLAAQRHVESRAARTHSLVSLATTVSAAMEVDTLPSMLVHLLQPILILVEFLVLMESLPLRKTF